jgi:hypothetical protein
MIFFLALINKANKGGEDASGIKECARAGGCEE